jgi:hypothetical protein
MVGMCALCFGEKGQKEYQTGKLVDVQSEEFERMIMSGHSQNGNGHIHGTTARLTDNHISVRLGDLLVVGECIGKRHWSSCKPGEWVIGDPIEVRVDEDKMYLKKPNGKELKTKIVKRVRAGNDAQEKK